MPYFVRILKEYGINMRHVGKTWRRGWLDYACKILLLGSGAGRWGRGNCLNALFCGRTEGYTPRGTSRMLMNGKIIFDRYYCIDSAQTNEIMVHYIL